MMTLHTGRPFVLTGVIASTAQSIIVNGINYHKHAKKQVIKET
jgi:hypothetical protein